MSDRGESRGIKTVEMRTEETMTAEKGTKGTRYGGADDVRR